MFAGATAVAAFASLGLFLRALNRMLLGPLRMPDAPGAARNFGDLRGSEQASILPLLALAVLIGVLPRFLLDVIEPAATTLIGLVSR